MDAKFLFEVMRNPEFWACDGCGRTDYNDTIKYVEIRVPRPSDRSDMCCIMAGCSECFPGQRTPEEWDEWIESEEAIRAGYMFLS